MSCYLCRIDEIFHNGITISTVAYDYYHLKKANHNFESRSPAHGYSSFLIFRVNIEKISREITSSSITFHYYSDVVGASKQIKK